MRIQVDRIFASIQGKKILKDLSLTVDSGQSLALIGPNGSGKSTLLRVIAGLLRMDSGAVLIGDDSLQSLSSRQLAQRVGFVSQEATTTDAIAVEEAVKLGRTPWLSLLSPYREADARIVAEAIEEMVIGELREKRFNSLSGGEKQRVHIARVLAQTPQVFLLDEPTNHLDIRHQIAIMDWVTRQQATIILALHDLNYAFRCDRVGVLNAGRLIAYGMPLDVLVPEVIEPVFQVRMRRSKSDDFTYPILTFSQRLQLLYAWNVDLKSSATMDHLQSEGSEVAPRLFRLEKILAGRCLEMKFAPDYVTL